MKIQGIYKITCTANNKIYIGSSTNMQSRWSAHIDLLNKNMHTNKFLQKDFNKYGIYNFTFTILEIVNDIKCKHDLFLIETKYIVESDALDNNIGYNISLPTARKYKKHNKGDRNKSIGYIDIIDDDNIKKLLRKNLKITALTDTKNFKYKDFRTDYAFTHNWYLKSEVNCKLVKNMITNYFMNIHRVKANEIYWTSYVDIKNLLKGKGYTKGFVDMYNVKKHMDKRNILAYCSNVYMNPFSLNLLDPDVDLDRYSLNTMLSWIVSVADINKPIHILIPSLRMVKFLNEYILK